MSGANFVGISGVLAAFFTFIWRRPVEAPWEKYQLQQATFIFIMIFILGLAGLQTISFLIEALTGAQISTFIANTAHIAGALVGLALSKIPFFTKSNANPISSA
jgi:GlpG protein